MFVRATRNGEAQDGDRKQECGVENKKGQVTCFLAPAPPDRGRGPASREEEEEEEEFFNQTPSTNRRDV